MTEDVQVWWAPEVAETCGPEQAVYLVGTATMGFNGHYWDGEPLPADAVRLVPEQPPPSPLRDRTAGSRWWSSEVCDREVVVTHGGEADGYDLAIVAAERAAGL